MLSSPLRRRYLLPLLGPSGLTELNERILTALNAKLDAAELKATLRRIPGLSHLRTYELPEPLTDEELQKKYDLPPPGPLRLHQGRMLQLIEADRRIRLYQAIPRAACYLAEEEQTVRGVLVEQRFICAWTHDGHCEPGLKLVRPATQEEDAHQIDAVMESDNGSRCFLQLKGGANGNFYDLASQGIILVRLSIEHSPEQMRQAAISAILTYTRFKKNQQQHLLRAS